MASRAALVGDVAVVAVVALAVIEVVARDPRSRHVPRLRAVRVQLDAHVELAGVPALMSQLARRAVKKGVDDNLT